ncbi:hypothetical protein [Pseudanabaena sp. BC1403]|uniref:hypothetical protein n=1 Tax=Pseudanabaena sp. BC1403 TaxID=2043171 RepID=UPI0011AEDAB0|nr:hypothetical protein [Pseudanabaena sp. BC1403]
MNRQPLNVELLTLDDGTQKIAWDIKQLQSLLGISDLLHQEESSSAVTTGVNSSGIPTIETVIAILDELGLKDLYEVRYRKQYATIIPKTDSKRPKVAMYVVQQQSELALSIHEKIWSGHQAKIYWYEFSEYASGRITKELYIPVSEKSDFIARLTEVMQDQDPCISIFEENLYSTENSFSFELRACTYTPVFKDMHEQNICYELTSDQRFPSTSRIALSDRSHLTSFLSELKVNIETFFRSNGEKPENSFKEFKLVETEPETYDDDF